MSKTFQEMAMEKFMFAQTELFKQQAESQKEIAKALSNIDIGSYIPKYSENDVAFLKDEIERLKCLTHVSRYLAEGATLRFDAIPGELDKFKVAIKFNLEEDVDFTITNSTYSKDYIGFQVDIKKLTKEMRAELIEEEE